MQPRCNRPEFNAEPGANNIRFLQGLTFGGSPIAELDVCFQCGEWAVTSGPDKLQSLLVTAAADASFHALCRELGLGDCWSEDELANVHFDSLAERGLIAEHHGGVEDLGIDPALSQAKTTTLQKHPLCRWAHSQATRWRRGWPLAPAFDSDDSGRGVRCTDDPSWAVAFRSADECAAKFPGWDVSVGDVERCLSRITRRSATSSAITLSTQLINARIVGAPQNCSKEGR